MSSAITWGSFTQMQQDAMNQFMRDYYHKYLQGNDTATKLSNTDFFRFLISTFDKRGNETIRPTKNTNTSFLSNQKY